MRQGLGWVALGAAVAVGSWRMDRLESLNIEPWSAPGLVPGVLGLAMLAFGLVLASSPGSAEQQDEPVPWSRLLPVLALCAVFAFAALGRMPFELAAALLMFVWIAMLGWASWPAGRPRWVKLAQTLLLSVLASLVISHLFQDLFLVRLP